MKREHNEGVGVGQNMFPNEPLIPIGRKLDLTLYITLYSSLVYKSNTLFCFVMEQTGEGGHEFFYY